MSGGRIGLIRGTHVPLQLCRNRESLCERQQAVEKLRAFLHRYHEPNEKPSDFGNQIGAAPKGPIPHRSQPPFTPA